MASTGGIKGFFRQKKGGVAKKPTGYKKKPDKITIGDAAFGPPGTAQAPALIATGKSGLRDGDYGEGEEKLKEFDMDMKYGPCVGLTRLERWERATSMGLNPPPAIRDLLISFAGSNPALECLWEGRV